MILMTTTLKDGSAINVNFFSVRDAFTKKSMWVILFQRNFLSSNQSTVMKRRKSLLKLMNYFQMDRFHNKIPVTVVSFLNTKFKSKQNQYSNSKLKHRRLSPKEIH
jgi:hypothetical protein